MLNYCFLIMNMGFPGGSDGKESACNVGDPSSIPGSERSSGEGNGNLLQYSCLGNPMDGRAWGLQSMGPQGVGHDLVTSLSLSVMNISIFHWRLSVHKRESLKTFYLFIYFHWRLITLQYCGGFFHTLTWISHGYTCVPHPEPAPLHLPPQYHPSG